MKSKKLRDSARMQDCMVRIPGVCNRNPETVVLAHLNGGGMGMKKSDLQGAFCCSACHDAVDSRSKFAGYTSEQIKLMHREGVERTQDWWEKNGYIKF